MTEPRLPKPICVLRIPTNILGGSRDITPVIKTLQEWYDHQRPDYYWFVLPINNAVYPERDECEFEVFYEKDRKPIDNDELKALIQKALSHAGDE